MRTRRTILAGAVAAAAAGPAAARTGPVVTGPITGGVHGWPFGGYDGDLGALGYVEEEFFLEGEARRFEPVGSLGVDGRWTIRPASSDRYRTRILVRRPRDPKAFNGTVVVEWANVSAGFDHIIVDPPGLFAGFAHVAVSAQPTGITGFRSTQAGLIHWDPERYGGLTIPDEGVSFDIFTQAARAVGCRRSRRGPDPMGGLKVRRLIAAGASQSGTRVMAYLNGVQPRELAFDAFMPIICAGTASDFSSEMAHPDKADVTGRNATLTEAEKTDPQAALAEAARSRGHSRSVPTRVRDDLRAPVFAINTETEAFVYSPRRQPDNDRFRSWEIAGASHAPASRTAQSRLRAVRDGMVRAGAPELSGARGSAVAWLPCADAAIRHVHVWLTGGTPPPRQPPIEIGGVPPAIVRDAHGNAVGGVRLPELEVPIATYHGQDARGSIGGETIPFSADTLRTLYPTHADYVEKVRAAALAAERAGVILPDRVKAYVEAAEAAPVPPPPG